jgi:hypothetical protein
MYELSLVTACETNLTIIELRYMCRIFNSFQVYHTSLFTGSTFGLSLWCLTRLSTIFQLHHGGQFYWGQSSASLYKYNVQNVCTCMYTYNDVTEILLKVVLNTINLNLNLLMIRSNLFSHQ